MSIQVFGSDGDSLARAAEFLQKNTKADILDINMGCPVNKIVKNEAGAMWLKDPEKIYSVISSVKKAMNIPLTVKMRTGWVDPSLAVENALAAEAAGVSALAPYYLKSTSGAAKIRSAVAKASTLTEVQDLFKQIPGFGD